MIMVGTNLGSLRSVRVGLSEAGNHRSRRENGTCKYATKVISKPVQKARGSRRKMARFLYSTIRIRIFIRQVPAVQGISLGAGQHKIKPNEINIEKIKCF